MDLSWYVYERVMSQIRMSCVFCRTIITHLWTNHVTNTNESHGIRMNESCHKYEWVIVQLCILQNNHYTPMNKSCHKYEWVMVHVCILHNNLVVQGPHFHKSRHTQEQVVSQIRMSHGTVAHSTQQPCRATQQPTQQLCRPRLCMSWHTWEWVMSHIWMSHGTVAHPTTLLSSSLHAMAHMRMSHVTHLNESWHSSAFCTQQSCLPVSSSLKIMAHMRESCYSFEWVMAQWRILQNNLVVQRPRLRQIRVVREVNSPSLSFEIMSYDHTNNNVSYISPARSVWSVRSTLPLEISWRICYIR